MVFFHRKGRNVCCVFMPFLWNFSLLVFLACMCFGNAQSLYDSQDDFKETTLPREKSLLEMQQEQMDLIKKEFHGNPAERDLLLYKQEEAKKAIQKDSTLQIKPEHREDNEEIATTGEYEFIVRYVFKIVDEIPRGEEYKVAIPLHGLRLKEWQTKAHECSITTRQNVLNLTLYEHYTAQETRASKRKQTQYLLYNLLQEYKAEVLECLLLKEAHLDDMNTTLNLQARTKTLASVHAYMLVDFHGGILTLQVFSPRHKK